MNSFRSSGYRRAYSNSGSAISSGDVIVTRSGSDGEIGIAVTDIAATTGTGEIEVAGDHELTKATGVNWVAGARLYWDASNGNVTNVASGNTKAGTATTAQVNADTTAGVLVNDRPRV